MSRHTPCFNCFLMKHFFCFTLFVTLSILNLSTSFASAMPHYSLERLIHESHLIGVAQAVKVQSFKGSHYVYTDTTLKILQPIKGSSVDPDKHVTVRQRGGQLKDFATLVPGMPTFKVGERALVFLTQRTPTHYVVTGMWYGKHLLLKHGGTLGVMLPYALLSASEQQKIDAKHQAGSPISNSFASPHSVHNHDHSDSLDYHNAQPLYFIPLPRVMTRIHEIIAAKFHQ